LPKYKIVHNIYTSNLRVIRGKLYDVIKKTKTILRFHSKIRKEQWGAPTFEEIKVGLGFSSLGTVNWYVRELIKNGHLRQEKGFNGKRALAIVEDAPEHQLAACRVDCGWRSSWKLSKPGK
jgi:SOS-response transcriptional repressor LexA